MRLTITITVAFVLFVGLQDIIAQDHKKQFSGRIVKIVDGDTFDILTQENKVLRIRMNGIDAPEKSQPFGQKSKDYLGRLCFKQTIKIIWYRLDRNKRYIADGYLPDGRSLSLEMVRAGYAWHFKKYSSDPALAKAETEARQQKFGLWLDPNPEAPWDKRGRRN